MRLIDPIPEHRLVAVFGLGCSGIAAAHLLHRLGKRVVASDCADERRRAEFVSKLPEGTELVLGQNAIGEATLIVTSPGLEPSLPIFEEAKRRGIGVISELELAALSTRIPIVAITGTDGKTTTTSLTSHLLRACGKSNALGGNIGIPLAQVVVEEEDVDCYVVETSAFQLAFCHDFCPRVVVATNIAEDHSEYFKGNWEEYVATKCKMLGNMSAEDVVILNASDEVIRGWASQTVAKVWWYGEKKGDIPDNAETYAYFDGEMLHFIQGMTHYSVEFARLKLRGVHNAMNEMGAILAALSMGGSWEAILSAFESYELPRHRIETVCVKSGIEFIDDSKATNPHAGIAALRAVLEPTVLIVGGVDKGLHLSPWLEEMRPHVKHLMVIGALGDRFCQEAACVIPNIPRHRCESLEEAVERGYELAKRDSCGCVLLSPGCSSYDMFKSYSERGEVFARAARGLCEALA